MVFDAVLTTICSHRLIIKNNPITRFSNNSTIWFYCNTVNQVLWFYHTKYANWSYQPTQNNPRFNLRKLSTFYGTARHVCAQPYSSLVCTIKFSHCQRYSKLPAFLQRIIDHLLTRINLSSSCSGYATPPPNCYNPRSISVVHTMMYFSFRKIRARTFAILLV